MLLTKLKICCAHDVAAAYRLAMAEVRVRLPLGALVSRQFQGVGKLGNPRASEARDRRFESGRPDCGIRRFVSAVAGA